MRRLWGSLVAAVVLGTFGASVVGFGHHLISADHGVGDRDCVVCKIQSSTLLACGMPGVQPAPVGEVVGAAPPFPPPLLSYLNGPPLRGPPVS